MAIYILAFGLEEYFSQYGFRRGTLAAVGNLFRAEARTLIEIELSGANLPFSCRERGQKENPCGLCLVGTDENPVSGLTFDKKTGIATFESETERQRHGQNAAILLEALTKASLAFRKVRRKQA